MSLAGSARGVAIGLAGEHAARDDDVSAAEERDATVITHDGEFTLRRKRNTFGRHVRFKCHQVDGSELLAEYLEDVLVELVARPAVVVEISRGEGVTVHEPRWD